MANYTIAWKAWFEKSGRELRTAKVLLDISNDEHLETVVFLCQQVAEKAIKGYLAKNKVRFDKTHNIEVLLKTLEKSDLELARSLAPSVVLSKYAVAVRYPEETEEKIIVDRRT